MMNKYDIADLIRKYNRGTISPEDRLILEKWYLDTVREDDTLPDRQDMENRLDQVLDRLQTEQYTVRRQLLPLWTRYVAASVILALLVGTFIYKDRHKPEQSLVQAADHSPLTGAEIGVLPGTQKAMLLIDGQKKADLSGSHQEIITNGSGLVYDDGSTVLGASVDLPANPMFSLVTPRGGHYQVVLPDGSRVWLNAASSISYPRHFPEHKREVTVTGEAYFEVVTVLDSRKNKIPFVVNTEGQRIEVLGTAFNVYAYPEEDETRTTLFEGMVKVYPVGSDAGQILYPGKQAVSQKEGGGIAIRAANLKAEAGWRNGYFEFNDEPLHSIMLKIGRWYDVAFDYSPDVNKEELFGGSFSREADIMDVLRKIELTGALNFKLEHADRLRQERRVRVMK